MQSKLVDQLRFKLLPVAIYFTDTKPDGAAQFEPHKRGCVATMLVAAAKGKTAVFDEDTYGCPGGGVGLCFGDAFTKNSHPTDCLLSTGDEALAATGQTAPFSLGRGERFFASPELVQKWRSAFPYVDAPQKYVVFRPLSEVEADEPPDLVMLFANPDQLSTLVIMAGFNRGCGLNAIAPFAAACQSIVWAYPQMAKDEPQAVIGFFDISQRQSVPKELLSFTVPFSMFLEMDNSADEGCLTTHSWEKIAGRFDE